MQAVLAVSGRVVRVPHSRPGHMAWSVVMPKRLGMRCCTWAMFWSDSTKVSGTTSDRLSMKATTAYTSLGWSDLGVFQGMARLM